MAKGITIRFNILATIALWTMSLVFALTNFEVGSTYESNALIDIYIDSLIVKMTLLLAIWVASALVLSKLFNEIWNRLISDIFKIRQINFSESYALSILITWVLLS
ncbi:hypothetical protein V6248_16335 [Pseudoalteromonas agarivorans]|uniref:hypothetical protein n=1 Tax=Pseudoalteromonas agarivorans TaxID=176102 RepID=UPI00311F144D